MKKSIIALGLAFTMAVSSYSPLFAASASELTALNSTAAFNAAYESESEITTAEFAKLFAISATYEHGEDGIKVLTKLGMIKEADHLAADNALTIGDALKIVMRALGYEGTNYYTEALNNGVMFGFADGTKHEDQPIVFWQAKQIIKNYNLITAKQNTNKPVPVMPVEDFFKAPDSLAYYITSDGKSLIYVAPWKNRYNIFSKDIESGVVTQITKVSDRDLNTYFLKDNTILYMKDFGGDENFHIFKPGTNGEEIDLTPYEGTRVIPLDMLNNPSIENKILIMMNLDNKEVFSVYKLDIVTGKAEKVIDNTVGYSGFMTDNNGKILIAGYNDGVNSGYFYRATEEDEFKLVKMFDFHEGFSLISFTSDNKTAYALSNIGRDKYALVKVDVATGEVVETIYENDEVDVAGMSSGKTRGTLGTAYYYTDKEHVIFYDKEIESFYTEVQKLFNDTDKISISSVSSDWKKAIITTYSDTNRGKYYFYNRDLGTVELLADANTINTDYAAEMTPISFTSRDGLTIHGYLTLPKNVDPHNLPVVINPHGGPWARDYWGYNREVQFLANRGYAVLQLNFRASTGYGREFLEAGYKQWGLDMQNDITDGVEWLIETGIADPERVGIYGASYGGYATLAGVAFTPDLYAAAVDYVGVSNLFSFLETIPPYWESQRAMLYEQVGNPETDAEQFTATSPALNADKITTPLFIAQGANDPRVNKAESDQMVAALLARGVEVEYMVKANEGHGFSNYENSIDFYSAMETFFAKYLGGATSPSK